MYTILGSTKNRTLRVIWTLEELGLPYNQVKGNPGSAEIKALNPSGKVPALVVNEEVLPDSVAIMTFLADRHNALTFPAGSLERLRMEGHIHFLLEEFDSLLWIAAKNAFVNPPEHRAAEVKPVLKWEFERSLKRLEDRPSETSLCTGFGGGIIGGRAPCPTASREASGDQIAAGRPVPVQHLTGAKYARHIPEH